MRITKLHILFLLMLLTAGGFGFKLWEKKRAELKAAQERIEMELAKQRQIEEEAVRKASETAAQEAKTLAQAQESQELKKEKPEKEPSEIKYQVRKGDTLWNIAKRKEHFGLGHRWYDLWKSNEDSIEDFDHITAGQILIIPLDKPENYGWEKTSEEKKKKLIGEQESEISNDVSTN